MSINEIVEEKTKEAFEDLVASKENYLYNDSELDDIEDIEDTEDTDNIDNKVVEDIEKTIDSTVVINDKLEVAEVKDNSNNVTMGNSSIEIASNRVETKKKGIERLSKDDLLKFLNSIGALGALDVLYTNQSKSIDCREENIVVVSNLRKAINDLDDVQALVVTRFESEGIDLLDYLDNTYKPAQMRIIGEALKQNIDVTKVLNSDFSEVQMLTLLNLQERGFDITDFANPSLSIEIIYSLCKAQAAGVNISNIYYDYYTYGLNSYDIDNIVSVLFDYEGLRMCDILDIIFKDNQGKDSHNKIKFVCNYLRNRHEQFSYNVTDNGAKLMGSDTMIMVEVTNEVIIALKTEYAKSEYSHRSTVSTYRQSNQKQGIIDKLFSRFKLQ